MKRGIDYRSIFPIGDVAGGSSSTGCRVDGGGGSGGGFG